MTKIVGKTKDGKDLFNEESSSGNVYYYYYYDKDDMYLFHRDGAPAIEYFNGDKEWWVNGNCHREDGPAVERVDGRKEWWLNNEELKNKEEHQRALFQIVEEEQLTISISLFAEGE